MRRMDTKTARGVFAVVALAALAAITACGGDITVTDEIVIPEPPPSDARSAGVLSGFSYSRGGERYKIIQTLGSPTAETLQSSADGRYEVK